jgi:SAM-dependent methyltransferase
MRNSADDWNKAAKDFQTVCQLGLNDYNAAIIRFWQDEGMLPPGARFIDIGCGVGKYGARLAELGYDVTLTDISSEMLRLARENMARYTTPWAVYHCDFNDASPDEPIFAGGFDLAISTMSPAIHDLATVKKMSAISRAWCFLARFSEWKQPFRDEFMRRMGREPRPMFDNMQGDCEAMLSAVREAGFEPKVRYVEYNWSDERTPEDEAEYISRKYFSGEDDSSAVYKSALAAAKDLAAGAEKVRDEVMTKVAWIYWHTKG